MKQDFKIGYRSLKTVLAVSISLVISWVLGRGSGFYGANAAIVCMQPTHKQTIWSGVYRVLGTLVGGLFGYILLTIQPSIPNYAESMYLVLIPLFSIVVIGFCALIGQYETISMSLLVFLSIATNFTLNIPNTVSYVIGRVIDTSIGIVVAMTINYYVFPYKEQKNNLG